MNLRNVAVSAFTEIRANKVRNLLSLFAIAIGIATFFYTLSVLSQRYDSIAKTVSVAGKSRFSFEAPYYFNMSDYSRIMSMLPHGTRISPQGRAFYTYLGGGDMSNVGYVSMVGVLPTYLSYDFTYKLEGRFINWQDVKNKARVTVLKVAQFDKEKPKSFSRSEDNKISVSEYTKKHDLLGKTVLLSGTPYKVVGILKLPPAEDDIALEHDSDSKAFIPYSVYNDITSSFKSWARCNITVLSDRDGMEGNLSKRLEKYFKDNKPPSDNNNTASDSKSSGDDKKIDFEFAREKINGNRDKALKEAKTMLFLGLIAMIAGGIGIMNVTMAVVFARTKEIGIRRALGATKSDIMVQFMSEAVMLGVLGSLFGMILGYIALVQMAKDINGMTFSWWVCALSVLIAVVTSFLFALYPAWKAASLKPIEALKCE